MSMMGGGSTVGLNFIISGNASGATNAAAQANNALAQLSNTVATNWWGLQNLGLAFAALPAAVAAGAGAAVKSAIAWEDAMFVLSRSTGDSARSVEAIGEEIMELSKTTPIATTALAALAATGAQLGVANENVAQFAEMMGLLISSTNLTEANVGDFARVINVMQLPADQWERFANTLLEVGRNTAALETEILNISKRISGAASVAGFTSDQVLGLGAALISLGPRAEAGGTAMNKTISDMTRAVANGGDELQIFAAVAGRSIEDFSQLFRQDAAQAVAAFVTGLARLRGGGEDQINVLDDLGITEQRQVAALQQLAQGTLDVGNEQRDLNAILGLSQDSWANSNALQEIAAAKAKTFSGQIQLLKNALFELGTQIGAVLVGPLGFFVEMLQDFLAGIQAMPKPMKILYGALFLLVTGLSALGAAIFLVGPRILIAVDAFRRLTSGAGTSTLALGGVARAANNVAGSMFLMGQASSIATGQIVAGSTSAQIAMNMRNIQNGVGGAALATNSLANAAPPAAAGMGLMAKWGSKLAKVGGLAALALTALSIATVFLGDKQRKAAAAAERTVSANETLISIMRQQGSAVGPASAEWIFASHRYRLAADAAETLGLSLATLNNIIMGMATPAEMDQLVQVIKNGGEAGAEMGRRIIDLASIWQQSAAAAQVATHATEAYADEQSESADEIAANNEALQEQYDALLAVAQAYVDLASAQQSQFTAQESLAEAQQDYNRALSETVSPALALLRAELQLAQARFDQGQAQRDLAQREVDLAEARANGIQRVRDAELGLADARDSYEDSIEEIADLEEQLEDLRNSDNIDEIRDATLKLRDAELSLAAAHTKVSDAEWYLQHLREEGASARDLQDAEQALAEAQQGVANANDDLIDSTQELDDLRSGEAHAEEIADLEEQLAQAYRDSERSARDLAQAEETLSDARTRLAQNLDYIEAQDALVDAQLRVQDALLATRQAELDLQEVREGRISADALQSARQLEEAIIAMAQANVEVRRQQALANGQTWDAGDAAHALADELQALIGLAPDAATAARLQNFINTLRQAPNVPDAPVATEPGNTPIEFDPESYGLPALSDMSSYLDELQSMIDEAGGGDDRSIWEKIWEGLGGGSGTGALVGGGIGFAVGNVPGAIVGTIMGAIIGGLAEKFWPEISGFFEKNFERLVDNLPQWTENIGKFFGELPAKLVAGMVALPGLLSDAGRLAIGGLGKAFTEGLPALIDFFKNLPEHLRTAFEALGPVGEGLKELGGSFLKGFIDGLGSWWPDLQDWFRNLPENLRQLLTQNDLGTFLSNAGRHIIQGFVDGMIDLRENGVVSFITNLPWRIFNAIDSALGGPINWLIEAGRNVLRGFWNGLIEIWNDVNRWIGDRVGGLASFVDGLLGNRSPSKIFQGIGENVMLGFRLGLESQMTDIERVMQDTAGMLEAGLARDYMASMLSDPDLARMQFTATPGGMGFGAGGNVTYINENLNLEAITTADPTEIVNQYVWAKRVRTRGG